YVISVAGATVTISSNATATANGTALTFVGTNLYVASGDGGTGRNEVQTLIFSGFMGVYNNPPPPQDFYLITFVDSTGTYVTAPIPYNGDDPSTRFQSFGGGGGGGGGFGTFNSQPDVADVQNITNALNALGVPGASFVVTQVSQPVTVRIGGG